MLNAFAFKANYIKVVEVRSILLGQKYSLENLVFGTIQLIAILKAFTENKCINDRHPFVIGSYLTNTA